MTKKCEESAAPVRRAYGGLSTLAGEVRRLTRPILGKRGFTGIDILAGWSDILGEELARGVVPEKLTFAKDARTNGTLHVKTSGGAFAILFEHQKAKVIARINTYFGYPAVARIQITQGSLPTPQQKPAPVAPNATPERERELRAKLAHIRDDALREKLVRIGLMS
ncbi:MAG: DciA family protein [Alphaproteobacteria bacterium]|nr:DciA family protein [Alphaproteobacteria bacterium]